MGNCLVMEKKVIKIVRNDGEVLEYREPISVHHILSQFSGHSLADNNTCHLLPDAKLLSGRLYYLLPTTRTKNKKKIKKVSFANPEVEDESLPRKDDDEERSVVRMKIVVHKQELEKLLQGGSVHEMVYQSIEKQQCLLSDNHDDDDDDCNRSWRPVLDCIPESE